MRQGGQPELGGHAIAYPVRDIYVHCATFRDGILAPLAADRGNDAFDGRASGPEHAAVEAVDDSGKHECRKEHVTHEPDHKRGC